MIHRDQLNDGITEVLTRWTWPTAEAAASAITEAVMQRLADEPGLDVICDAAEHVIGVCAAYPQAETQADPPDCVRRNEAAPSDAGAVPADPCDGLPLAEFSEAPPGKVYRLTPEEQTRAGSPEAEFKPGEVISRFRPLPDAEPDLPDGLGRD